MLHTVRIVRQKVNLLKDQKHLKACSHVASEKHVYRSTGKLNRCDKNTQYKNNSDVTRSSTLLLFN